MKTIKIITARQASNMSLSTLFKGTITATKKLRYDKGKYAGSSQDFIGRQVDVASNVLCIFPKMQKDKDGPYVALWCYVYG